MPRQSTEQRKQAACDRAKRWRENNPERYRALLKTYYREHQQDPLFKRRHHLKYRYGITIEQYREIESSQGGCCAICRVKSERALHVDHDHQTGKVRGLLCDTCNRGLGYFRDNIDALKNAAAYLEN